MISFTLALRGRAMLAVVLPPVVVGTLACGELAGLAGTQQLPAGTHDPSVYRTVAGAQALYQEAVTKFQFSTQGTGAFVDFVVATGLMTDELSADRKETIGVDNHGQPIIQVTIEPGNNIDARQLLEGAGNPTDGSYRELQIVRGSAEEGIGALATYAPGSGARQGHLYALEGYAELFLADLFCSGVPLSTLDFNADYTYHAGSTTDELYADAKAKFDTAIVLARDSAQFLDLARVGKGRAWLALGKYDSAAVAVADVPDDFQYQFFVDWTSVRASFDSSTTPVYTTTVSERKGVNGLPYRSDGLPSCSDIPFRCSHDPRVTLNTYVVIDSFNYGGINYWPLKYTESQNPNFGSLGITPIIVADGREARLIQAEAALKAGGDWLGILNHLRATVPVPGTTQPASQQLGPLTDPGSPDARVDLLFHERAYWLFLTGHRQGDMRRLIRQYDRNPLTVYPQGAYPVGEGLIPRYDQWINAPVPAVEQVNNLFTGCKDRNA